jgi:hypothetical protein
MRGKANRDITAGMTFGRLTVIEFAGKNKYNHLMWLCECSCEEKTQTVVRGTALINGGTKSCGCIGKEKIVARLTTHGQSHKRTYQIWRMMIDRCYNKNHLHYNSYGGRGISICTEWLNDYLTFERWAQENGYKDKLTLDRIDVNGNYCPENCQWATQKEQMNNKRDSVHITINGETKTVAQWAELYQLKPITIYQRFKKGITGEDIIKQPKKSKSGEKYISWDKELRKWKVVVPINGWTKTKYLGSFSDLHEAVKVRDKYLSNNPLSSLQT